MTERAVAAQVLEREAERVLWLHIVAREIRGIARDPRGLIAITVLVALLFVAFVIPVLDTTAPNFIGMDKNAGPSWSHPMGTDQLSRDLLARNTVGLRTTMINAIGAVILGWLTGITIGYIAGSRGGIVDTLIIGAADTLLAFPGILLAIVIITIMVPGITSVAVAIAIFNVPTSARLARAQVLRERERQYVEAARTIGASGSSILFRHVAINTFGLFVVQLPIAIVASVLIMAALNFLGLGTKPPDATLGQLFLEGSRYMRDAPHYVLGL